MEKKPVASPRISESARHFRLLQPGGGASAGPTGSRDTPPDRELNSALLVRLIGEFAHELRGPLGAMLTSVHLVQARLGDSDPAATKGLDRIRRGVDRCDDLMAKLQEFTRNDDLFTEPTAVDQWLRATVLTHRLPEGVALTFKPGLGDAKFKIDRDKLERAIAALVQNAALAGGQATRSDRIFIETRHEPGLLEIRIADNGPGIAEEDKENIFEPFFSTKHGNVGLSLAIARRFVEMHGGRIEVETANPEGSIFIVQLPDEA